MKKNIIAFLLSFIFVIILNALDGFSAGPYLLDVTQTEATVAFFLKLPLSGTVLIKGMDNDLEFISAAPSKQHFIRITGLQPGTSYIYEVICGSGEVCTPPGDQTFEIRTAGRTGESFSFVVYGDPRPGNNLTHHVHERIVEQVLHNDPVFCLVLGDMVDDGAEQNLWETFFKIEEKLLRRTAIYPVMGDNDYSSGKGLVKNYFPVLDHDYYHFTWSGTHFFGLNAWDTRGEQLRSEIDANSRQLEWLVNELRKQAVQEAPFRIVFLHDPVFISRGRSSDILKRVWEPVFRQYKVDLVFASWHLYERSQYNGVRYIITGGAGAELIWMNQDPSYSSQADARRYNFVLADITAGAMTLSAVADDGTILDTFIIAPQSKDPGAEERFYRIAQRTKKQIIINPENKKTPPLQLHLFSYDCSFCRRLLAHELPQLAKRTGIPLAVNYYNLGASKIVYDLFMAEGSDFGRQDADIPAIFIGNQVLGGEIEITGNLENQILKYRENAEKYIRNSIVPFQKLHDTQSLKENSFLSLTTGMVLGAGLLDGINPCAFTTLIFLISYLSMVGGGRKKMLLTGTVFTIAVFITYLTIGFLFFQVAQWITGEFAIAWIINWILLAVVLVLAILSARDFILCLKGKETEMSLQLPDVIKKIIHTRIRKFARSGKTIGILAFILGIVIAGMELACTGQVYIPIVTMISEPKYRSTAVLYLIMYNTAFILPMVGVFLVAAFGVTSIKLAAFFKKKIAIVKLLFSLLFIGMGLLILYNINIF